MTRDMELVRQLLMQVADDPKYNGRAKWHVHAEDFSKDGFTYDQIDYHFGLLIDAGFLVGEPMGSPGYIISKVSWEGHEFLDDTRDPDIWEKTKDRAQKVAGVGLGLVWEIAKAEIKARLGMA